MGIIRPRFWTSPIGRSLRQYAAETRELAVYLSSCDECDEDPYGLYRLDVDTAVMLTNRPIDTLKENLAILERLGFCFFHPETQWVFVREYAAMQVQKLPLVVSDMKCRAARLWYRRLPDNPFLGPWWDRYGDDFNLAIEPHAVQRREWGVPDQPDDERPAVAPEDFALIAPAEKPVPFSKAASFDRIAAAYPGSVTATRAKAAYYRMAVGPVLEAEILAGIERLKRSYDWIKDNGKYIPAFHNFLNDQRWRDRAKQVPQTHLNDRTLGELAAGQQFIEKMTRNPQRK